MHDAARLQERVSLIVSEKLHIDFQTPETDLIEAGLMDSITFVKLLLHLEQDFGLPISVDNLEIEDLKSVSRITAFIAAANGHPG